MHAAVTRSAPSHAAFDNCGVCDLVYRAYKYIHTCHDVPEKLGISKICVEIYYMLTCMKNIDS